MNAENRPLVDQMLIRMKNHPVLAVLIVIGIVLIALSQFTAATNKLFTQIKGVFSESSYQLVVELPDETLMLRWNGLVNSWRHPVKDLSFETELRLPLRIKNSGNQLANIEALRLISQWQGQQITWEAVWSARDFEAERFAPIEAQIQQHRDRLTPFAVEPDKPGLSMTIDFAPVDYALELRQGSYRNLLQAKQAGTEGWVDLQQFDFTIPDDFELSGTRISRYQYWQSFPLHQQLPIAE